MSGADRNTAIDAGSRYAAADLEAQGRYTLGIAASDRGALLREGLLQAEDFARGEELLGAVSAGARDRALAHTEAQSKTEQQDEHRRGLTIQERRLDKCAENAFRGSPEWGQYRALGFDGVNVPRFCASVRAKVAFLEKHAGRVDSKGAGPAVRERALATIAALEQADREQEATRGTLPDAQRAFAEAKGRLYLFVKQVNTAGQALHADDLEAAAKYSMRVLYRSRRQRVARPTPAPAP